MPKCDFNKFAKQLHWNHTSAWVFSCKFAAYFHNNFSQEHLWVAASGPPVCFLVSFLKFFGGGSDKQTNKQTNNQIIEDYLWTPLFFMGVNPMSI